MLSTSPAIVSTRAEELFGTQNNFAFTRSDLLRFLTVAFACAILSALRRPDSFSNPQFWAEDGTVFFLEHYRLGWKAVLEPYAGYLHLIPRLVAAVAEFFPIVHAPLIYNLAANILLALCTAWISLPAFRHLIQSDARRAFVSLLFAASPIAGTGFHNITNIQWPLLLWAFLVTLQPVQSRAARIALLICYAITVMTAVCAVLFVPLWLVRAVLVHKDRFYCAAMVAILGLYAVAVKLFFKDHLYTATPPPLQDVLWMVPEIFVSRVIVMATAGPYYIVKTVLLTHFTIVLIGIGSLLGMAWIARRLRHDQAFQLFMVAWIYASFATLGLFALYRNVDIEIMCFTGLNDRYVLLGGLLTTAIWLALSERLDRLYNSSAITAVVVVLLVLAARSNFFFQPHQDFQWPVHAEKIEAARRAGIEPQAVPINPDGWFIFLKE